MEELSGDLGPAFGLCDWETRTIFISSEVYGDKILGVCRHELFHAFIFECHLYDPTALQLEETGASVLQYHFDEIALLSEKMLAFLDS